MRTVREVSVAVLSVVVTVTVISFLGSQVTPPPAGAVTPQWQTTASFNPLVNVSAVSCAPSATASSATCVAVGNDGGQVSSIIVTNDGGAVWASSPVPAGVTNLSTISCPSAAVCYAGGGSGLLKSSNGGTSWTVLDSSFVAQSISCFTIDECTAVGGSQITKTTDGTSWNLQTPPSQTDDLRVVSCPNAVTCVAVGTVANDPSIVGESNGTTWNLLNQPVLASLSSVSCSSGSACTAIGIATTGGATSLSTSNGGSNWSPTSSIPHGIQLNSVVCPAANTCIAVGTNLNSTPYAVGTTNSGTTWTSQSPPPDSVDLSGISCSAATNCVAVGSTGNTGSGSTIATTTTGGLSWAPQNTTLGTSELNSVSCPSSADCFAVGNKSILSSVNEGFSWTPQSVPSSVDGLNSISCPTSSDCTAVGYGTFGSPIVIGTINAGITWTSRPYCIRDRCSDGSVLQQQPCLPCRQQFRFLPAEHRCNHQRWRELVVAKLSRSSWCIQ